MYNVAIIGAGVIGGMIARELSKYNLKTVILEKGNDVAVGATKANSGIVHGGYDPEPETLKAKLNTEGVDKLYAAAKQLNVPIKNNGSLVVAFGKEQEPALYELLQRGQKNNIKNLEIISGDKARLLEPNLSAEVTAALYVPNAGIVCPYELTIAAVGNAMDNGVELRLNFEVAEIEQGKEFTLKSAKGEAVKAEYIFNCAGAYSDKIAALIGDKSFKIIPRAGEYMLLDKAEGSTVKHTVFQVPTADGKGILVTPTVDGNLLTGPTATAVASPEDTHTTPVGLKTVNELALRSVPTVDFRQVITSFTGVRASTAGGDFIIAESCKNPAFINVAAIDSPGLTCCVSIAEMATGILFSKIAAQSNPSFNPIREDKHAFRKMNNGQKDAFIRKNPAYGRTVCRCEDVSEGEIIEVINSNPKPRDTDGIKRRTRQGMGRCQGGFCLPVVLELLAKHSGQPIEEITKNGEKANYINEKL